jgi:hypothetical protein
MSTANRLIGNSLLTIVGSSALRGVVHLGDAADYNYLAGNLFADDPAGLRPVENGGTGQHNTVDGQILR